MICDDCIKKEVCKYKEGAGKFEELVPIDAEAIFRATIECKHKDTGTKIKSPPYPSFPSQPLGPGVFPQRPYSPTSPYDRRITWDGRLEITCSGSGGDFRG